ncbi:hypothetical protein PC129_g18655 [Phytophthora cactorum]|uniref:Retrotransposon gag domain-containing protein n=1 Tax=Phytophthora cactorum TaxID=29920 RepID=A0A8T1HCZ5_9STRA|nr:hypothetical protein PC114_g22830 [Phytophthora cactorum]KAG3210344.1 hypothetical protein PC129_g18655 [Phytophthora cactorum]KAG4230412.1 hypothetical protein PC116_g21290 [Phytophthora cactorum]
MHVGQLMMNHTKGKAKAWLLEEYRGEHRWSHIMRMMKKRFVTKSRQEDLVAKFFDCIQRNRSLDTYRDEFRRLARTAGVSEYIKILRYKQGLSSTQLLHLLKTKSFETLNELIEASRTLNPSETGKPTEKGGNKGNKMSTPSAEKKIDIVKCTSLQCTEKGHTKERCWMLHSELQPEWIKDSRKRKGKGAAGVSKTSEGGKTDKPWPDAAISSVDNWVFDSGTAANTIYFQAQNEKESLPATYLIKNVSFVRENDIEIATTFFDEGADFCGISAEFVEKVNWGQYVTDAGSMAVTYANGKIKSVRNQTIRLTVFVDNVPGHSTEFQVCHIPNNSELMLGAPWKRARNAVIDWDTDRIYTKEEFIEESLKHLNPPEQARDKTNYPFCRRFGETKVIKMKQADKLVRKKDVEFIAVIPPETVNALYNEMVGASKVAAAHGMSTGKSDKAQRQQGTGMHSFKDNPGYDLLQAFEHIFRLS